MKKVIQIVSFLGLGLTVIPSFFVFAEMLSISHYKTMMLVGTLLWLFSAPFWINGTKDAAS
ncbi:hypothetical protein [Maribacter sp. 2-571]|uniref:hypothetical protein n=1 Tax=Maribacter sp. 2-571 TaxID=3417569 RepID=UPI003D334B38